jgi:hypothetical protein
MDGVLGRDHTQLTKQKQNKNSVFGDKFATIMQHLRNIYATSKFYLGKCSWCLRIPRVASPVGKNQKVSV